MPKFVLAYHGHPDVNTPEEGAKMMAAWKAWMAGLGTAALDPGLAVGPSKTVLSDGAVAEGGGANPLSGYTVIEARDMDAAIELVRGCPHLSGSGTIEVAPDLELDM
ncbi:MAG: hypothetical protein BM560_18650 [Roseobacter sp. MedPE-SWde]|nr:MAG: hypothetical protein BM560_18650 [Roseobacter sp. MedPE-SWde]